MKTGPSNWTPWLRRPSSRWLLLLIAVTALAAAALLGLPHPTGMGSEWNSIIGHAMPASRQLSASVLCMAIAVVAAALRIATAVPARVVSTDESGVRLRSGNATEYLAYGEIADASLASGMLGRTNLVLRKHDGSTRAFPLADARPNDLLSTILARCVLARTSGTSAPLPAAVAELARKGRPAGAWLDEVRAMTRTGGGAYRVGGLEQQTLLEAFEDERQDVELRAACAHVLATMPGEAARDAVVRVLSKGAAPLVVLCAAVVPEIRSQIDPELITEALSFVSSADRAWFGTTTSAQDGAASVKIRTEGPAPLIRIARTSPEITARLPEAPEGTGETEETEETEEDADEAQVQARRMRS